MSSEGKPQPQITLYRGWPVTGKYVWSPFVTKVEARLRFAGVSYRVGGGSLLKAPRGKIPYLEVSRAGEGNSGQDEIGAEARTTMLSDSTLIAERLVEEGLLEDWNAELEPVERANDLALRAMVEDKLYFYQVRLLLRLTGVSSFWVQED